MSQEFDPYLLWLGISKHEPRPVNHYRLLGVERFESDADVIAINADKQIEHLRKFSSGPQGELAEKLITELTKAKLTLLKPERRARYNETLSPPVSKDAEVANATPPREPTPQAAAAETPASPAAVPPAAATQQIIPAAAMLPETHVYANYWPPNVVYAWPSPVAPPLPRITPPLVTPPQVLFQPAPPPQRSPYPLAYVPPPPAASGGSPALRVIPRPAANNGSYASHLPIAAARTDASLFARMRARVLEFLARWVDVRRRRVYVSVVLGGLLAIVSAGALLGIVIARWGFDSNPAEVHEEEGPALETPLPAPEQPAPLPNAQEPTPPEANAAETT